jgi:hypothetical protein
MTMPEELLARKIVDNDLVFFAEIASFANFSLGVTLLSKGAVLTGNLISAKSYYSGVGSSFGPRESNAVAISEFFWKKFDASPTDYETEKDQEINFLHLSDVRMLVGNGSFTSFNGGFLRIKLEEIDGHMVGVSNPT